jgi:tetratricopeptide (TPR) repeat protein
LECPIVLLTTPRKSIASSVADLGIQIILQDNFASGIATLDTSLAGISYCIGNLMSMRKNLMPLMKRIVLTTAGSGLASALHNTRYGIWTLCEFLLPHALTCAKWTFVLRQKKPEGVRLLNVTGLYLYERAQYREAEPLLQRALSIREEQLGATHPNTTTSLNNLAALYESLGRYGEAELLYQRAVTVALTSLGMEHPQTQQILMNHLTLFQLLAQREQNGNKDGEVSPE